jgi:hypothetical protein
MFVKLMVCICIPCHGHFVFKTATPSLVLFSLIIAVLLLFTHQNIERLLERKKKKALFLMSKRQELELKQTA